MLQGGSSPDQAGVLCRHQPDGYSGEVAFEAAFVDKAGFERAFVDEVIGDTRQDAAAEVHTAACTEGKDEVGSDGG